MSSALIFLLSFVAAPPQPLAKSWEETRQWAKSQHGIVHMLIKQKKYSKAVEEAKLLFAVRFPDKKEHMLVKSAQILSREFCRPHGKFVMAHAVLDHALQVVSLSESKALLFYEKAAVSEESGEVEESMKYLRLAQKHGKSPD